MRQPCSSAACACRLHAAALPSPAWLQNGTCCQLWGCRLPPVHGWRVRTERLTPDCRAGSFAAAAAACCSFASPSSACCCAVHAQLLSLLAQVPDRSTRSSGNLHAAHANRAGAGQHQRPFPSRVHSLHPCNRPGTSLGASSDALPRPACPVSRTLPDLELPLTNPRLPDKSTTAEAALAASTHACMRAGSFAAATC